MTSVIENAMANLCNTKSGIMYAAYQQKGGWEGWAQVEIAIALAQALPTALVQRELQVYAAKPTEKADIQFVIPGTGGNHIEILELKCWGQLRDQTQFVGVVQKDIDKIMTTQNAPNTRAWAMVLVSDPAARTAIKNGMLAKRRTGAGGTFIDQVKEVQYPVPGNPAASIFLLSFLMPVNVG